MTKHDSDTVAGIHTALHSHLPPEPALRVKALESLLVEKGMVDSAAVDAWIEVYTEEIGPKRGAEIVARAWVDPGFKARLFENGTEAVKDFGIEQEHLQVVENTADVHNMVVCTLCSCYPTPMLGIPPTWYKMAAYRSRAVRDPRGVLEEFGVDVADDVEVRVWDSTAEIRYLVVPQRPAGTEDWDEPKLARLVTRNSMIGTERDLGRRIGEVA
ncbi:MAG: nitrile hydratase subunit alpha [Rhodospirillales bacterium]|jgi:nitrile hydratase|nr:nitrile hydratase subunit alpha [Rhodospirillales bacterium]